MFNVGTPSRSSTVAEEVQDEGAGWTVGGGEIGNGGGGCVDREGGTLGGAERAVGGSGGGREGEDWVVAASAEVEVGVMGVERVVVWGGGGAVAGSENADEAVEQEGGGWVRRVMCVNVLDVGGGGWREEEGIEEEADSVGLFGCKVRRRCLGGEGVGLWKNAG